MTVTWNPVTPDSESVSIILQYKVRNADPPELCQLKLGGNVTSHRITGNILYFLNPLISTLYSDGFYQYL